jgi:glyceraldehyde-3-phosphate dehydrogenase (NAD(P))
MLGPKTVLVVGTGTIGEPLVGLLCFFKDQLGIDEVLIHKRTPLLSDRSMVQDLIRRGAGFVADADRVEDFRQIGVEVSLSTEEALEAARVVVDCTPDGNAMKEKWYHEFEENTRLFVAQGSEFGFGKPYARGINDAALDGVRDKYLQVISCNTHNLAALIQTLGFGDDGADNLLEGRFVCMRRSNDISQDGRFVPSPTVEAPTDERFGSHHARDAWHLFRTLGHDLALFSSAMRLNNQLMHVVHYDLHVRRATTRDELLERVAANDRLAVTYKHSANTIFSFGRDHGFYGRILNHAVFPVDALHVAQDGKRITGFCFTPQDGNSLLSSVAATVWGLYPETYEKIIQCLRPYFFAEV